MDTWEEAVRMLRKSPKRHWLIGLQDGNHPGGTLSYLCEGGQTFCDDFCSYFCIFVIPYSWFDHTEVSGDD